MKPIAHVTDPHLGQRLVMGGGLAGDKMRYDQVPGAHEVRLRWVFDDIARKGISEIVFGGDIGNEEAVERFFEILGEYGFTASIVLGNHDRLRDVSRYWNAGLDAVEGKMCSSQDDGHLKRIFLDSSDNMIGAGQLAWLTRELEEVGRTILFLHHPILGIDTPLERAGASLRDRRETMAVLTSSNCEVSVLCGHYHMIDEAHEANVSQFITPAVSYQIIKQSEQIRVDTRTFGYRLLDIGCTELKTEVVLLTEAS